VWHADSFELKGFLFGHIHQIITGLDGHAHVVRIVIMEIRLHLIVIGVICLMMMEVIGRRGSCLLIICCSTGTCSTTIRSNSS
jgi:hypothetical protein